PVAPGRARLDGVGGPREVDVDPDGAVGTEHSVEPAVAEGARPAAEAALVVAEGDRRRPGANRQVEGDRVAHLRGSQRRRVDGDPVAGALGQGLIGGIGSAGVGRGRRRAAAGGEQSADRQRERQDGDQGEV
ncbi:hypothetical protein QP62_00070, partial [Staphylococcus aureus]